MLIYHEGWYINAQDIKKLTTSTTENTYTMIITLRDESSISTKYKSDSARRKAMDAIAVQINRPDSEPVVSRFDIEYLLSRETEKIKRDLRRLRQQITAKEASK